MKKALVFVLSAVSCAAQKGGAHSSDPSVKWTIYSYYQPMPGQPMLMQACDPTTTNGCIASAITGDGNIYSNGSNGVSNSVIHFDGATYDATLLLSSPRSISFNLQYQVASLNSPQPAWANSTVSGAGFLNVSHILEGTTLGDHSESDYTTRFTSALPVNGKVAYHLRMVNPGATEPEASYYGSFNYNTPYDTALVWVHHCPDNTSGYPLPSPACPADHKESWYVYPDAGNQSSTTGAPITQVSTLVDGLGAVTGIAQYTTPFFFKIELQ